MMKFATKILAVLLIALLLCGCSTTPNSAETTTAPSTETTTAPTETTVPPTTEDPYPYDFTDISFFEVENCLDYAPKAVLTGIGETKAPFNIKSTSDGFTVAQGACSDGTYGYFLQANTSAYINGVWQEGCKIIKVDMRTWEIVAESEPLAVCHGNGMGYNSKTNKLVVAHNKPEFKNISVIDPETLQVEQVVTIDRAIQSIAYNEKRDQYVVRMSGNWNFAILDANFQEVAYYETGVSTPLGSQCMTCDDDYIYLLDSGVLTKPGYECFTVYTWEGKYVGIYRIPSVQESEAIIVYNDEYYLTFYNGSGTRVYKLEFDKSLLAE